MYKHKSFISERKIGQRVRKLAAEIDREYRGKTLDIVCVLKGGFFFVSDLMRALKVEARLHFVAISSYRTNTASSGTVTLHFSSVDDLKDKDILVVEDILDTGITLDYLIKYLGNQQPASIKTCVLLDKPERRRVDIKPDFTGFQIPNHFMIGYGLDYREFGRNLKYIAILDPKEYENP
jgi:hypoxanthine phosphoribosyltransferase